MFRRLFSDIPLFYNIYFHLIRKHRGMRPRYFTSETNIYYDGYQRSGNTYLGHLIKKCFPQLVEVHHLHKIAPLKIALRNDISTFILIRAPEEAISSNYLKHYAPKGVIPEEINFKLLNRMTSDYYHYYNFVFKNQKKMKIIKFNKLINSPVNIVKMVGKNMNIELNNGNSITRRVKKASASYSGSTTKYGSSKPNVYKEREKDKIKKDLPTTKNYKQVKKVYQKITN